MTSGSPNAIAKIHEALRQLERNRPNAREAWEFLKSWHDDESHEAAFAILAATILEQALESAISTHFAVKREEAETIFVDQSEGSLSAFSMKIKLAYALGIIEKKVRKELTVIKTVRNALAHAPMRAVFSADAIATTCNHLFIWKELPFGDARPETAKRKYAKSIEYLHAYLRGSVTEETERVPLLFEDSDFYCSAFLNQETYPKQD